MNTIWKISCLVAVLVIVGSMFGICEVQATTVWEFTPPFDGKTLESSGGSSSGIAGYGNSSFSSFLAGKLYFWVSSWAGPGLGDSSSFAQSGIYKSWVCPETGMYRITFTLSYEGIYGYSVGSPVSSGYGFWESDLPLGASIYDATEGEVLSYKFESLSPFSKEASTTLTADEKTISGTKDFVFITTLEKDHEYHFASYAEPETRSVAGGIGVAGGKIDFSDNGVQLEKITIEETKFEEFTPPFDGKTLESSGGSSSGIAGYENSSFSSFLAGKLYFWVSSWAGPGFGDASSYAPVLPNTPTSDL